jgi:Raf kinase inhibitor-like YbhB/YbcL family protein
MKPSEGSAMELRSPDFSNQARIPQRFSCDGDNIAPALEWSDVPAGTAELALICEDPDAPGKKFVHWVLWGIDPGSVTSLGAGDVPAGSHHGRNDFGDNAYGGPCPPPGHGTHHYHFTLFAVREPISLSEGAPVDELRGAIADNDALAEATLVGTYER